MTTKYERLMADLASTGTGVMKCFGNSMLPKLRNPCTNTYERRESYAVGDIVFCKVRGRFIDAHLVAAISPDRGWLITNIKGHQNGWTRTIYGKVVRSEGEDGSVRTF